MKPDIRKFSLGGESLFSAVANPYTAGAVAERKAESDKTTKDNDDGIISKDVMNALLKNGIPNDVLLYMLEIANLENNISLGMPVSKSKLYALKAKANTIIQASNYLYKAETEATKNGALDEIAVDSRGYLYTINDNGELSKTSLRDYNKSGKHALTVGELILLRKYSPQLANDVTVATTIGNNVGIEKINDYIKNIILTIGTSISTSEAYVDLATLVGKNNAKKPTLTLFNAIRGLANLLDELGPDAIFKITEGSKSRNLEDALRYIVSVLPDNMRNLLYSKYVVAGNSLQDAQKNVIDLIKNALVATNSEQSEFRIDYDKSMNADSGGGSGSKKGSSKTFYLTPNEALFDGDLNLTTIRISDPNAKNESGIYAPGVQMPALTTDDGKAVSNLPLGLALNATVGKYLNKYKMYMGEQKINEGMLNNIAYSSDLVAAVSMPSDVNGNIDWEGFHAFSAAESYIKDNNITDLLLKNNIHALFGSYARYNLDGSILPITKTAKYLLTYGYTIDDHIADDNTMVEELEGLAEDDADALLSLIYNKPLKLKTGISGIDSKQSWDDIYKVPVYVKINDFASSDAYRYGGHGSNMTPHTLEQDKIQQLAHLEPTLFVQGSTDALYN